MIWGITMLQLLAGKKIDGPSSTLVWLRSHKAIKAQQRVSNSAAAEATVEDRRPSCPGAAHQHWTTAASSNPKSPEDPRVIVPGIPRLGYRAMRLYFPVPVAILSATKPFGNSSLFFLSSWFDTTPFDSEVRMTVAGAWEGSLVAAAGGRAGAHL